ncbi:MAG: hypothetical protein IMW96_11060 [Thermoanaerobacteraceae bacterium]|nr:hypothetical protein [Thermoanaerobacteraceae bacterium]
MVEKRHLGDSSGPAYSRDEIEISINGTTMRMVRHSSLPWPHEASAFIPRAELRRRRYQDGRLVWEEETLLNSITIVHSPLHPLAGAGSPEAGSGPPGDRPPVPPWPTGPNHPPPDQPAPPLPASPAAPRQAHTPAPPPPATAGDPRGSGWRGGPRIKISFR